MKGKNDDKQQQKIIETIELSNLMMEHFQFRKNYMSLEGKYDELKQLYEKSNIKQVQFKESI